jgi:uncharacterized protein (TIGR04255 family)
MPRRGNPLVDSPPVEVRLAHAPLERVIAQVRFPEVLSVEQREFVAPFQEEIRAFYPVLRPEQVQSFVLGPSGLASAKAQTAWRFSDLAEHFRVSLTPEFLTLETTRYESRQDFFARFAVVLRALERHVRPAKADRIGVRYVDRLVDPALSDLRRFFDPQVVGMAGTSFADQVELTLTESVFQVESAKVLARWGMVPGQFVVDAAVLEPVATPSFVLDFDMSCSTIDAFDVDATVHTARSFAERIYALFRWCVTDEFLRHHGGNP